MKLNSILYEKSLERNVAHYIKNKINKNNFTFYRKLAGVFKVPTLLKASLNFIERWFTVVAETPNFSTLDFNVVKTILKSSELDLTSEVQVLNAVDYWVGSNVENRSKFAAELLLNVRFSSISLLELKSVFGETNHISYIDECRAIVERTLKGKDGSSQATSRYCSQNMYSFVLCNEGSHGINRSCINLYGGDTLKCFKRIASIDSNEEVIETVCLKGEIYVFLRNNSISNTITLKKHSMTSEQWESVTDIVHRKEFCACTIADSIFVLGGRNNNNELSDHCLKYDTKYKKVDRSIGLNLPRFKAACAVFQGNIVVSGGLVPGIEPIFGDPCNLETSTVEVFKDGKWSGMPSTVYRVSGHSLVAVKNKLFVIGDSFEVFDDICRKFVVMKKVPSSLKFLFEQKNFVGAVSLANKIFVFRKNKTEVFVYDVIKEEWTTEICEAAKSIKFGCCVKLPQ